MKVKRLTPNAVIPTRATEGAHGYDIHTIEAEVIHPGGRVKFRTGVAVQIPFGYAGCLRPRSGLADGYGIQVMAGEIDSDYTGELQVILYNSGSSAVIVDPGQAIAQLKVHSVYLDEPVEVADLDKTDRGGGGFGSTGR